VKRRIIGLSGRARSGKSTVAAMLVQQGFRELAFAQPLKEMAKLLFSWDEAHVNGDLKEELDPFWGFSPRWALQKLGTEGVRNVIGQDTWVKATQRKIQRAAEDIVVSDCRFPNEAELIRVLGGEVWRIERPDLESAPRKLHESETSLDKWPHFSRTIQNDGPMKDLGKKVYELIK